MNNIITYLNKRGFNTINGNYYARIKEWNDWYRICVDDFHKTEFYNGISVVSKILYSLGMAKTVSEDWANLLLNEKVEINVGSERGNQLLNEILKYNNFQIKGNQLCEIMFALGSGAFVEYISDDKVMIDYIYADMIYPLAWNSKGISECAFGSNIHTKNGDCIQLQIHFLENGKYVIENHLILADEQQGFRELELPDGVIERFETNSDVPLFQIITPNLINNIDLKNPMGISVYANALDVLKEIDTTFDALNTEIETGRRMIFLASELFFNDENGQTKNVVGQKEKVLRYIGEVGDEQHPLIHDYTPQMRVEELKNALQYQLNLLSEKCGMGTNRFEFGRSGVKTATEIISEDDDLYKSLKKHEIVMNSALIKMVEAIALLSDEVGQPIEIEEITINFDDSIIEDKKTERLQDMQDVTNGTFRPEEYRAKWRNETIEEALQNLPKRETDVMQ